MYAFTYTFFLWIANATSMCSCLYTFTLTFTCNAHHGLRVLELVSLLVILYVSRSYSYINFGLLLCVAPMQNHAQDLCMPPLVPALQRRRARGHGAT